MANKPSQRTHRSRPDDGLNLTPLIDMITCLMFFLMMFASILPVVIIDAPLPKIASTAEQVKQAKNTENKLEVTIYINSKGMQVKADSGADRSGFWVPPGEVFRVMSPLEQCLQSNDIVICSDVSDIREAIPVK